MLPNLIIAGVPKAGTTSLFTTLASHPDVCGSNVKEAQYFRPMLDGGEPAPLAEYEALFTGCGAERYRLEATPEYLYGGTPLIERMCSVLGDVRAIVLLREPVGRTLSFYRFKKAHMHLPAGLSFREYIAACEAVPSHQRLARDRSAYMGIEGSHYDTYLPDWLAGMGDALELVFFDDLIADPARVLGRLASWLGIDPAAFPSGGLAGDNRTTHFRWAGLQRVALWAAARAEGLSRRHPALYRRLRSAYYRINGTAPDEQPDPEILDGLACHFAPHNARLAELLRRHGIREMPGWLAAAAPGSGATAPTGPDRQDR
jgi:hypothetical protein